MRRIVSSVLVAAGVLAVATINGASAAETKVKLHLDWLFNGYHAPFVVAADKGWYRAVGLDVTIVPGRGSVDSVKAVGSGNAQFGFPDAATAVKAASEGIPVTMVAVFLQKTPMGIVAIADKGVAKPKDLEGKSLSNVPIASTAKVLPAFLKRNGVDITKIKMINHTFATAIPSVLAGKVDAGQGYIFGEYLAIKNGAKGRKVNWISFADHGIQMYSNGLAVNNDFLRKNPKVVAAFVNASLRGLKWTMANVDGAIDLLAKRTETARATLKEQLEVAIPLMVSADTKANGLGWMTKAGWKTTQDIMIQYGGQKKRVPDAQAYTTQFLK